MNERYWIWITPVDSLPAREGRALSVAGHEIALFNLGHRIVAIENRCPHKGGPLADGIVSGDTVVCPLHAWRVNVACGTVDRPTDVTSCVMTYPVRIDDGIVVIGLPAQAVPSETGEAA
jgi:nitrite reductase (NADH) small subunit